MRHRVAVLLSLCLGGCASNELARATINNEPCVAATECPSGFVCVDNVCTSDPVDPGIVHVEVAGPVGSGLPKTQLLDALPVAGMLNLTVPDPVEFEVAVLNGDTRIGATLVAYGQRRIADREADVTLTVNADLVSPSILRLRPDTYSIRLIPTNRALPGFQADNVTVRATGERQTKEFFVPETYRVVRGNVVSSVANTATISGVVVRAVATQSGLPSTESVSDDSGAYEILLPDTDETEFLLTAEFESPDGPSWSFEQPITVQEDVRDKQIELELTDPALRGRTTLKILGLGESGAEPIANASVTLTSSNTTSLDTRVFSVFGVTDGEGFVTVTVDGASTKELPILAGRYIAEILTPIRSPYASTEAVVTLEAGGPTDVLTARVELGRRTLVVGEARTSAGAAVRSATVELVSLATGRLVLAEIDADGSFAAEIDPGAYAVVIRSQRRQNGVDLPVHVEQIQVGAGARFDIPTITLPRGVSVRGNVSSETQGAVNAARVEFFVRTDTRTISIAKTETDAFGDYTVVLPQQR